MTHYAFRSWGGTTLPQERRFYVAPTAPPPETAEERRRRQQQEQRDAERARRATADARAVKLLRKHLTKKQRRQFDEVGNFEVISSTGRRFEILPNRGHNVFLLDDDGNRVTEYCGYVRDNVPYADNMLAQKLLIETDEPAYLRTSNATHVRR